MSNFIVQFALKTEKYQEDILNKRFEIGRKMYNALANIVSKRYTEMEKTKEYREIKKQISENYNDIILKKKLFLQLSEVRRRFGIYEYAFYSDIKKLQKHYKKNIDSSTSQKIASTLWRAYEDLLYRDGERVRFKRYDELNSLESNTNASGIRFRNGNILWNGLDIPVKIKGTKYEQEAFANKICYVRLIRKFIKNRYKFYVQIVFEGIVPQKRKADITGDVGLDIGTQAIAIASKKNVRILELADRVKNIENEKRRILRKLNRSRRENNPNNYNLDGTIKKQGNKKVVWVKSKRYRKLVNQLKELYRKQADVRKYQHECLSNEILSYGDKIYVEKMNYKGLQKRAKKTEKNEKGKYKCKKRFGKSLANKAPAMLISILKRKAENRNKKVIEINTTLARASQFNHIDNDYKKKKLSQRWNTVDGKRVQRNMYSAFLIMNTNDDLESFNMKKCNKRFDEFLKLHDIEVNRLKGRKNLSSIGI